MQISTIFGKKIQWKYKKQTNQKAGKLISLYSPALFSQITLLYAICTATFKKYLWILCMYGGGKTRSSLSHIHQSIYGDSELHMPQHYSSIALCLSESLRTDWSLARLVVDPPVPFWTVRVSYAADWKGIYMSIIHGIHLTATYCMISTSIMRFTSCRWWNRKKFCQQHFFCQPDVCRFLISHANVHSHTDTCLNIILIKCFELISRCGCWLLWLALRIWRSSSLR